MNTPDSTTETPSRLVDVNGPRLTDDLRLDDVIKTVQGLAS